MVTKTLTKYEQGFKKMVAALKVELLVYVLAWGIASDVMVTAGEEIGKGAAGLVTGSTFSKPPSEWSSAFSMPSLFSRVQEECDAAGTA